jgi:hypothetical protein
MGWVIEGRAACRDSATRFDNLTEFGAPSSAIGEQWFGAFRLMRNGKPAVVRVDRENEGWLSARGRWPVRGSERASIAR